LDNLSFAFTIFYDFSQRQLRDFAKTFKSEDVHQSVSRSGFFPEQAALIDPTDIRRLVSIEMPCVTNLTATQIDTLAKIPTLVMFGDHLNDTQGGGPANWGRRSRAALEQLKKAGGDAEMMHLPALGIRGNSLMLMQDRNSDQLADLVIAWIDKHVERKAGRRPRGTTR